MKNKLVVVFILCGLSLAAQVNCEEVREQYKQYQNGSPNASAARLLSTQLVECISSISDQKTKVIWTYNLLKLYVDAQQYEHARVTCDYCMEFAGSAYPSYYNNCYSFKHSLNGYTASNRVGRGASYSGKGNYLEEVVDAATFDDQSSRPFSAFEYERLIARRLTYPSGQVHEYTTYFKELVGTKKSLIQGPFILIGYDNQSVSSGQDSGQQQVQVPSQYPQTKTKGGARQIEQRTSTGIGSRSSDQGLEKQLNELLVHLKSVYQVGTPDYYIPVYLFDSDLDREGYEAFSNFTYQVHGRSAAGRVAYFNPIDLSVVAWKATGNGTLNHEIVHAMLLQDYALIPGWLNEGFASMFEETSHNYYPMDNYRLIYLKQAMRYGKMLTLDQLIAADRDEFNESNQAMLYAATARYFVMFLRDKGWLSTIYSGLKSYNYNESEDVAKLLVQKTGYGISALNIQFTNWLKYQQTPSKWASLENSVETYIREL